MISSASRRVTVVATAALLAAGPAFAALWADNAPTSVLADGEFEGGAPTLRLGLVDAFPLVAGGWGVRAESPDAVRVVRDAERDSRVAVVTAAIGAPASLVQDIPLATRSFRLEALVRRSAGRQQIRLLADWRSTGEGPHDGIILDLTATAIGVTTPAGTWRLPARLPADRWVRITAVADAREAQVRLSLDGRSVGSVPGIFTATPRTLVLGDERDHGASVFAYDDVSLMRLSELELARLRDALVSAGPAGLDSLTARIDSASRAIAVGRSWLAAPELRALARELERARGAGDQHQALATAAQAIARLVESD